MSATLEGKATSYTIENVDFGETWTASVTAVNDQGAAMAATASLLIGKTTIGFLSVYPTESDLLANGDDDESDK